MLQPFSCDVSLFSLCPASASPLITPDTRLPGEDEEALLGRVRSLPARQWERSRPFVSELIAANEPALLRGTVVDGWAARSWSWERLSQLHAGHTMVDVLQSDGHLYVMPDKKAALEPLLRYHLPHTVQDMSADAFFGAMRESQARHDEQGYNRTAAVRARWRQHGQRLVHFANVSEVLAAEMEPRELLFHDGGDLDKAMQYMWVSSPGVRTHTHFDSDHNIFVQLVGHKRFVLWAPNQTDSLCMFPRLHPMWHKSRVDFEAPDLTPPPCASYGSSEAVAVDVEAGDVLYVPPFWWHTVETLSPSVSLTTLSRYHMLYNKMRGIYRMQYHFDKLALYQARLFSLRAFLVQLVRRLMPQPRSMPPAEIGYFKRLAARYAGFEHLFQVRSACATTRLRPMPAPRHAVTALLRRPRSTRRPTTRRCAG